MTTEIVSTVIVAAHGSLNIEAAKAAFASTYVQNDLRNVPHTDAAALATTAINAYVAGEDNIVYIPFDDNIIELIEAEGVPVVLVMPSVEHHKVLMPESTDMAYESTFRKFDALDVRHKVITTGDNETVLILLHNIFNSDKFSF